MLQGDVDKNVDILETNKMHSIPSFDDKSMRGWFELYTCRNSSVSTRLPSICDGNGTEIKIIGIEPPTFIITHNDDFAVDYKFGKHVTARTRQTSDPNELWTILKHASSKYESLRGIFYDQYKVLVDLKIKKKQPVQKVPNWFLRTKKYNQGFLLIFISMLLCFRFILHCLFISVTKFFFSTFISMLFWFRFILGCIFTLIFIMQHCPVMP